MVSGSWLSWTQGPIQRQAIPLPLSGADVAAQTVSLVVARVVGELSSAEVSDVGLSVALTKGTLSNSEISRNLPAHL